MEERKLEILNKICQLAKQDNEFDKELRKKLNIIPSAYFGLTGNERIDQIYEYCIEKIVRQQSEDFYKDFPITNIKTQLVEDCIRMEFFYRKGNFEDFSLAAYQQIENIISSILTPDFKNILNLLWEYKAQTYYDKNNKKNVVNTIGNIIFGYDKYLTGGISRAKADKMTARDKIYIVVYYLKYFNSEKCNYKDYNQIRQRLYNIYLCRNNNHRGEQTNNTLSSLEEIYSNVAESYFSFKWTILNFKTLVEKYLQKILNLKLCKARIKSMSSEECYVEIDGVDNDIIIPDELFCRIKHLKVDDVLELVVDGDNKFLEINLETS